MATVEVTPAGTISAGKTKVGFFVGSLASGTGISLASDIGHAGFLNISFYIPGALGDWNPAVAQSKLTDPRLGSAQDFESFGVANWTIPNIKLVEDMQSAGTGTPKGLLVEGSTGVIIVRYGLAASTDWATTQRAWAWPVLIGKRDVDLSTTGEGGKFVLVCPVAVQGTAVEDVAIAA